MIFYLKFLGGSWNFHEAGHGKGIPDGIGGSIKRSADAKVGYGAEIIDASSFVKELNNNTIKVYEIKESEIRKIDDVILALKTIPGTMKVHQVFAVARSHLKYRDISFLPINCNDHPCDNFAFPGDSTEKIYRSTEG